MKKKKTPRYIQQEILCLGCKEFKTVDSLTKIIGRKFTFWNTEVTVTFEMLDVNASNWVCDNCVKEGKALIANPEKQQYCDRGPYLFYMDAKKKCSTCPEDFIFTKEEQQFWYEELNFWVQSEPINCLSCRKKIRHKKNLNTELSLLLKKEKTAEYKELVRISDIYREIGNTHKSTEYSGRAKKLNRLKNI